RSEWRRGGAYCVFGPGRESCFGGSVLEIGCTYIIGNLPMIGSSSRQRDNIPIPIFKIGFL
ncbi:MAG: hypothetical protein KDD63_07110, partial [Bacteroidetes bacterium]|nr:hypothetical protein [Bacteroidota bacterium]